MPVAGPEFVIEITKFFVAGEVACLSFAYTVIPKLPIFNFFFKSENKNIIT
jgi:hypothetical protein